MTVATSQRRVQYVLDGVTTAFPVPFPFLRAADLQVVRTSLAGAETSLVLNGDFTVSGAGSDTGGTVTYPAAGTPGERLTIKRVVQRLQLTDYVPNDPFPAEAHERALDLLTFAVQEDGDELGRALVLPDTDSQRGNMILPPMPGRAGKVLAFDADGRPATASIGAADGSLRDDLGATGGAALIGVSGGGSVQANISRINALLFDAARWGVVADGSDMTGPLHAVIDACEAAGGGIIQLPRGVIGTTGMDRTALLGVPWIMRGHGMLATALRKVGTSEDAIFRLTGPDAAYDWYGGFQDMAFDAPFGGPTPNYDGLHLRRIARCITDRIRSWRCKDGVLLEGALILNFNDCSVNGNERGYVSRKSGSTPYSNLIMWRGGECRGNAGWGFDLGEGEALYIGGVDVSGNGTAATGFTGSIIIRDTVDDEFGYARVFLENLYIEANTSRSLFVENAEGLYLKMAGVGVLGPNAVPTFPPVEIGDIASVHIEDSLLVCETRIYAQQSDIADSLINDLDDTSTVRHVRNLRSSGPPVPLSLGNGAIRAGAGTLGVYGATPIAKPTVTGSRASGDALVSLLTQLAAIGLFTDGTTA